jgi:hypothetical protein
MFPAIFKLAGRKTHQAWAEKATKGIDKLSDDLGNKYENFFAKIKDGSTKSDDLAQAFDDAIAEYPEGVNVGRLKAISERVKKNPTISAEELHALKQEIRGIIPKGIWRGTSDANAIQNAQRNLYFKITDKLGELGGKEYSSLSQEYKKFKDMEYLVNTVTRNKGVPSNAKIFGKLDVPTEKAITSLSKQLSPNDELAQELWKLRRGEKLKDLGIKGALGYGAYELSKDLISASR